MKKLLLIALLTVGCVFAEKHECIEKDWRFVMPEFEKELQILLDDDINLKDSSKFINDFGKVQNSWSIPHDIYFKNIKNNITAQMSQFLNPDFFKVFYESKPYSGMENYYSIDEIDSLYNNQDYLNKMFNKKYCVQIKDGFYTVATNTGIVVFDDNEGVAIHIINDYNQKMILNLKNLYNNFKNNSNIKSKNPLSDFLKKYDIKELQLDIIDGITYRFANPIFDIKIDENIYDENKDLARLVLENKYEYLIDCKRQFLFDCNEDEQCYSKLVDCINIESINMDSLNRAENIQNNILSLSKQKIYDRSYAIIIGINEYQNISDLDYAVNDAVSVKNMLINQFNYAKEDIKLLINKEANKDNIEQVLSNITLLANENDRIIVFFAGHGETMSLPDGGEMGYLLPVDGRQENLYASAIPMNDLKDLSHISKAKHMLFLIDACYGGLAAVGTRGLTPSKTPNYLEKITNIKARQIITAGGSDEEVMEKPEWGHSVYTMNLLRALKDGLADTNGDGYITAGELGLYLNEKVTIDSENQQTPQSRRLTSHEGEFIFFNSP